MVPLPTAALFSSFRQSMPSANASASMTRNPALCLHVCKEWWSKDKSLHVGEVGVLWPMDAACASLLTQASRILCS